MIIAVVVDILKIRIDLAWRTRVPEKIRLKPILLGLQDWRLIKGLPFPSKSRRISFSQCMD
jgi:hypothetical protein